MKSINTLVLASGSPRRQQLLREAGYDFVVHPADLDEDSAGRGLAPMELASHLAILKARHIAPAYPDSVVLAADTVVSLNDQPIGKARDADHAREILNQLSGSIHSVITGVAVVHLQSSLVKTASVVSKVEMRPLSSAEMDSYIAGGQWEGKAGAYGIQDNDPFVIRLEGCLTNIVGLPMTATAKLLKEAGIEPCSLQS